MLPQSLKEIQIWFAGVITQPLDENNRIHLISPSGNQIEKEAEKYIVPLPQLKSHERIQIYNQQYWWRLLDSLHDAFPTVTRLFGYQEFNTKIAIPYLVTYPSNHWNLNFLGNRLPQWIEEYYKENDKNLILNAARIDWAFTECFLTPHHPPAKDVDKIMEGRITLQPHIFLWENEFDLIQLREDFNMQEPEYWLVNDFPELKKGPTPFFVLYRTLQNDLNYKSISEAEYLLLKEIRLEE